MIETCWQLGGLDAYAELGLRRWAHMLGFRGHFLTKIRSGTPRPSARSAASGGTGGCARNWTGSTATPGARTSTPIDLDTVTVINDWRLVGVGHRNYAEQELAMAIAERNRQHRTSTTEL